MAYRYEPEKLCACGCGKKALLNREYAYKHSPEYRAKIKKYFQEHPEALHRLQTAFLGKKLSDATKQIISEKAKNRWKDSEWASKQIKTIKESHNTLEYKQKISSISKEYHARPETKEKIKEIFGNPNMRKKMSESQKLRFEDPLEHILCSERAKESSNRPDVKQKISKAHKELWKDPEYKKKMSEKRKKYYQEHPEVTEKMSRDRKGRKCHQSEKEQKRLKEWSKSTSSNSKIKKKKINGIRKALSKPEYRKQLSERSKKRWKDPKYHAFMVNARKKWFADPANRKRFLNWPLFAVKTKPEIITEEILHRKHFNKQWEYVGNGQFWVNHKNPDFVNTKQKKIIEVFGDYWHSEKITKIDNREHERQRKAHYKKYGWKVLIIWEHETKDSSKLEKRILKFHQI